MRRTLLRILIMDTSPQAKGQASRSVLITGAMKGIGAAAAALFLERGDDVIILDKEPSAANGSNSRFIHIPCDILDESRLAQALKLIECRFAGIDVLVNNVGLFETGSFKRCSAAEWRRLIDANLTSVFLCTKACLGLLREGSVVINISSGLASIPEPEAPAYCAAKAGVEMLTRCLALELAPAGIRVVAVAPGPVASRDDPAREACPAAGRPSFNPLGRFARADEVAQTIFFAASREASYMTGSILRIDGGESACQTAWSSMQELHRSAGVVSKAPVPAGERLDISPMERVRRSAAWVMERARHVRIDGAALENFAGRLSIDAVKESYQWERDFHLTGSRADLIDYVFTVDAMNFGCGFSPLWKARRSGSTYTAVARMLAELRRSGAALDADFASSATPEKIAVLLKIEPEFPLVRMYARSLSELGRWVKRGFGGYQALLDSLPEGRRARLLAELLIGNLSCFNDHALYRGAAVYFYKRAQIVVSDLHLALKSSGSPFLESEVAELTMFADNLIPHVLRKEGVLVYQAPLLERINRSEILPRGSEEEVELRAAGVASVDALTAALRRRGAEVTAAMVDCCLWSSGQDVRYKSEPRHLVQSFFY
jgi:NAD(P)-dependent dehydrogenase (short-subunit alcohol dehydrogenase family)